jgi:hypothetical protein
MAAVLEARMPTAAWPAAATTMNVSNQVRVELAIIPTTDVRRASYGLRA